MIVTIKVTEQDIQHGLAGDCEECPVALAIYRALPELGVRVGTGGVTLYRGDIFAVVPLPLPVPGFIARFDHDLVDGPFSFDLDVPDELVPAGAS